MIIVERLMHPLYHSIIPAAFLLQRKATTLLDLSTAAAIREEFLLSHIVTLHIFLLLLRGVCSFRLDYLALGL